MPYLNSISRKASIFYFIENKLFAGGKKVFESIKEECAPIESAIGNRRGMMVNVSLLKHEIRQL